jgi:hypothetical protein
MTAPTVDAARQDREGGACSPARRFWRSLPLQSHLLFLAVVFCLFSKLGFITDISSMGRSSIRTLVLECFSRA